jgi:hypothetical protein
MWIVLERALAQTSDPDSSAMYGQHWSKERVDATVAPSPEAVRVVMEWLRAAFGRRRSFGRVVGTATSTLVVPVAAAERRAATPTFVSSRTPLST